MTDKIILGTVQLGIDYGINNKVGKPDTKEAFNILEHAYKSGISVLDTANVYGNAEEIIGEYHTSNPKFKINTKFHAGANNNFTENLSSTLQRLHIDTIETYMYHRFSDLGDYPEISRSLGEAKNQGLINKTGISVYTNQEFDLAIKNDGIDVIQLPFNILDNYYQRGTYLQKAKQANKEIHVRSVFLQGLFFKDPEDLPEKLKPLKPYLLELKHFCQNNDMDITTLALQYALSIPEIDKVLIGVESLSQLENNIQTSRKTISPAILNNLQNIIQVKETELLNPVNWK